MSSAVVAIARLIQEGPPLALGFSGGKDSGVLSNLVMAAAKAAVLAGLKPLVLVTTSDTLCETPEVALHYRAESRKMQAFAKQHGFTLIARIAPPACAAPFSSAF